MFSTLNEVSYANVGGGMVAISALLLGQDSIWHANELKAEGAKHSRDMLKVKKTKSAHTGFAK